MKNDLLAELQTRARFLAGRHPRLRGKNDPVVVRSVKDAARFLDAVGDRLDEPNVSGGTTSNARAVISFFWHVRDIDDIVGVFVVFNADGKCDVHWHGAVDYVDCEGMTLAELIALGVPEKFEALRSSVSRARAAH